MNLFKSPRKGENIFIRLLREQADKAYQGVAMLHRYVNQADETGITAAKQLEKEGDELRRILDDELHKTFVTPFDREDIYDLSLHLDNVLDYAYTSIEEMQMLGVEPDQPLRNMVDRLLEAADELRLVMERLADNPMVALDHARRVKHRENQVEYQYRAAVAALFSGPEDVHQLFELLRRREVYRHISNAADQADYAANIIGSVVMKMT